MLITKDFVMINLPKTGSTFARKALMQLHASSPLRRLLERVGAIKPELEELFMHKFFFTEAQRESRPVPDQHGTYMQIPEKHKAKTIVSVIRDPEERLISAYEFRSWQRFPLPSAEVIRETYPHFPDLSFEEFVEHSFTSAKQFAQPPGMQVSMGPLTTQFIRFYAKDPLKTILSIQEDTDLRKDRDLHFPKVRFLHTEDLNHELQEFLISVGYPPQKVDFILDRKKENTSRRSQANHITPAIREKIRYQERYLYQLFPEYGHPDRVFQNEKSERHSIGLR